MSEQDKSVRRVVMSKRIARQYLEDKAKVGRSITAFFSREETWRDLESRLSHLDISYSKGFDHVTFLTENDTEVEAIKRACKRLDLEYDAV